MPWLGDGTWVQDAALARAIVRGRTNYRPWSHDLTTATPRDKRVSERNQDRSFFKEKTNGEGNDVAGEGEEAQGKRRFEGGQGPEARKAE